MLDRFPSTAKTKLAASQPMVGNGSAASSSPVDPVTAQSLPKDKPKNEWWEFLKTLVYAFLIAMVIRSFVFQPFNIPSGSMIPTLLIGDFVFATKYSFGYSKYSFPFSPDLFQGRIFGSEPKRGDVVIFRPPGHLDEDYIKRLIGLPGDRIQVIDGALYINELEVPRERLDDTVSDYFRMSCRFRQYRETLPNGVHHLINEFYTVSRSNLEFPCGPDIDKRFGDAPEHDYQMLSFETPVFTVPPGHYFFMGDNRDNSTDSRAPGGGVGFVPFENLVGKAQFVMFSIDFDFPGYNPLEWHIMPRFGRTVQIIR